jgi:hypothetical protein
MFANQLALSASIMPGLCPRLLLPHVCEHVHVVHKRKQHMQA